MAALLAVFSFNIFISFFSLKEDDRDTELRSEVGCKQAELKIRRQKHFKRNLIVWEASKKKED